MGERTTTLANAPSLEERAYRIRRNALRMGEVQGQGYIAQALGVADVLATAYFHALRYRPRTRSGKGATASCCPSATTPSRSTRC
jgi:transketolase